MANDLVPLANITLSSSASSVTFSSISGSYKDLVLVASILGATGLDFGLMRFNSDSGGNYSYVGMSGDGSAASSDNASSQNQILLPVYFAWTTTDSLSGVVNIMDYSATDKHKTVLIRFGGAAQGTEASAQRWASTSAVTSISIQGSSHNFASGSTFALYGVNA